MSEAVIVSALRTPQGKFGGALKDLNASELGSTVIEGLFHELEAKPVVSDSFKKYKPERFKGKAPVEQEHQEWDEDLESIEIDEVIMGNVLQGGQGQNPGRQASIKAGIPKEIPAYTVNQVCGSGMKAITLAAEKIENGKADAVIGGGFESMSNAPYILPDTRWGKTMDISGKGEIKDMMVWDGLYEIFYDCHMGITAENLAETYDISREEQERLSVESHNRAMNAIENGIFEDEIVPVNVRGDVVDTDECPRDTSLDALKELPPVFKKNGTITAGTSSGISDGAAAVLVTSRDFAEENDLDIMGTIKDYTDVGVDPQYMGMGASAAMKRLIDRIDYTESEIDLFEENEAFAAQILACMEDSGAPKYGVGMTEEGGEDINPHGSGISLGHPIGATGARMIVTLVHELKRRNDQTGLASLCIGGGMGISTFIER